MKTGIELIAQERKEQIEKHGWSAEHDSFNDNGELLQAARFCIGVDEWPENWDLRFADKISDKDDIGKLKVAGAFIAAEIDRLQSLNVTQCNP